MATDRAVGPAVARLRAGGLVALYDGRRDQGDLIAPAQLTTAAGVNAMAQHARGLVSVALTGDRARDLDLKLLPLRRKGGRDACERTPTMVSVEARAGISTGISAADRAHTIRTLADGASGPRDIVSPGHVFPLVACDGGLLARPGRLEAAVDAMQLAGLQPAAAICDVLDDRGDLAGERALRTLARDLMIPFVAISDLVEARCEELWNCRAHPERDAGTGVGPAAHALAGWA